jgi:D-glycero-D-manno-heptose 1,7-bisphosphate phosphatase
MKRAVFFDRDGTLCREVGYVNHPSRLELMPDTPACLKRVRDAGLVAVVATNQAGIARGYFPEHVLHETHQRLEQLLAASGAALDGIYACVHHPEVGAPGWRQRCDCRKPRPGLLQRAARDLDLDLSRSFMVGDTFRDVGAGRQAGCEACVMLRTGYGHGELLWKSHAAEEWPDFVADDLTMAVDWILDRVQNRSR